MVQASPIVLPKVTNGAASVPSTGGIIEITPLVDNATGPGDWEIAEALELAGRAKLALTDGRQAILVSEIVAAAGELLRVRVTVRNGLDGGTGATATFELLAGSDRARRLPGRATRRGGGSSWPRWPGRRR